MSRYENRVRKLENGSVDLLRVIVCQRRGFHHGQCDARSCQCQIERSNHLIATYGRGQTVVIPHEMADL